MSQGSRHHHHGTSPHRSGGGGSCLSAVLAEPDLLPSDLELLELAGWLGAEPSCETGWSCCQGEAGAWAQRWLNCPDCGKHRGLVLACDTCHAWVTQPEIWVECSNCSELYLAEDLLIHWERV